MYFVLLKNLAPTFSTG